MTKISCEIVFLDSFNANILFRFNPIKKINKSFDRSLKSLSKVIWNQFDPATSYFPNPPGTTTLTKDGVDFIELFS